MLALRNAEGQGALPAGDGVGRSRRFHEIPGLRISGKRVNQIRLSVATVFERAGGTGAVAGQRSGIGERRAGGFGQSERLRINRENMSHVTLCPVLRVEEGSGAIDPDPGRQNALGQLEAEAGIGAVCANHVQAANEFSV